MDIERHSWVHDGMPLTIASGDPHDRGEITDTNYWASEHCRRGLLFLSINAGTVRLLLPPAKHDMLAEMTEGVREVVLTLGLLDGKPTCELMFEDGSASPFCVHIETKMMDRIWPVRDDGKRLRFFVYLQTPGGGTQRVWFSRCYTRRTDQPLPYAAPYAGPRPNLSMPEGAHRR